MEPAPGPLTTRISTSPPGSGVTQPSGPPRLSTAPSLIGDSSKVSWGGIRWLLTYSGTAEGSPGSGEAMASEPCERGPGNRSTRAPGRRRHRSKADPARSSRRP